MAKARKQAKQIVDPQDTIGYCALCNKLVRREAGAVCPNGHESQYVLGAQILPRDAETPELPVFNWGAFFMPPIWGPAHGNLVAGLVLPLWLFMDSALQAAIYGIGEGASLAALIAYRGGAALIVIVTLALMFWYGRRGWGTAWSFVYRTGASKKSFERFKREQFWWAIATGLMFVGMIVGAVFYWTNYLPKG